MNFQNQIYKFIERENMIFKKPLQKIIQNMLNKCRYINNESLERHDWGLSPFLKNNHLIPKNQHQNYYGLILILTEILIYISLCGYLLISLKDLFCT